MPEITISKMELRQALTESFQAGFQSCIDFMEQEIERIVMQLKRKMHISCPYCEQPLRKHSFNSTTYWYCHNHKNNEISSSNLRGKILCPTCSLPMYARLSIHDFDMRSLVWLCEECNERIAFRLCERCFSVLKKMPVGVFPSHGHYCNKCGQGTN